MPSAPVPAAARTTRIALPERRRRYGFSMTAMADMLFQLLIFFMLSANLASFAMLDVRAGALGAAGADNGDSPAQPSATITDTRTTAVWTLSPEGLIASGQRFGLDRAGQLAEALGAQGTTNVLVVLRPEVPVQNVITVLETLSAEGINSVQIADGTIR